MSHTNYNALLQSLAISFVLATAPINVAFVSEVVAADIAALESAALNAAVQDVASSVVQIRTVGGLEQVDQRSLADGPTTGLVVRGDGYIVSSTFNFAQQPASILVRLPGGEQLPATIVGRDDNRMLTLLKVDPPDELKVPLAAAMSNLRVGDWSVAVGRTYRPDRVDVSVGVISALHRMLGRVVQTDANVSPSNYGGPLVDVEGRVIGVLVPMAPEPPGSGETSAVAGSEFYDSGIGFAVPLEHILAVLPRWIAELDLKRGLLGVGFKQGSPYMTPPVITAVWPASPAADAGWKKGDRIVSVDGTPVESQIQVRFLVAPHYAGDTIKMVIQRGRGDKAETFESSIKLASEMKEYRHAFLGVLPERESRKDIAGLVIRAVWPGSPAARAGLQPGDIISKLGGDAVSSISKALDRLIAATPGEMIEVIARRAEDDRAFSVKLDEQPGALLSAEELKRNPLADESAAMGEPQELKLAEFSQLAWLMTPSNTQIQPGLIVWLGPSGVDDAKSLAAAWSATCERFGVAIAVISPASSEGWTADDLEYVVRLTQAAVDRTGADPLRVTVGGKDRAGQLACAAAFKARQLIRGVATIDAPLPRTLKLPPNNPNERLAVLAIESAGSPLAPLLRQDLAKLTEAGYPVSKFEIRPRAASSSDPKADAQIKDAIARWLDGLDRI
jgi:serine protease Do